MTTYRSDHLALVVPKDHPLAGAPTIGFVQTLDLNHLGLSSNASVNALMQRIAAEKGRELSYRAYVSTFDAAYRFIQAGLAVAILPREAVNPQVREQYGLAVIPLAEAWAERHFVICVRDRAGPDPASSATDRASDGDSLTHNQRIAGALLAHCTAPHKPLRVFPFQTFRPAT